MLDFMNDPKVMRRVTGVLVWVSVIEWVVASLVGWVNLVSYVSHLSQLAITISLIPWWQGTKVEARQVEEDIPREVVEKLVQKTNVDLDESEGQSRGQADDSIDR